MSMGNLSRVLTAKITIIRLLHTHEFGNCREFAIDNRLKKWQFSKLKVKKCEINYLLLI